MGFKESCKFLSFVVLLAIVAEAAVAPHRPIDAIRRSSFPKDFVWGTASSAYQYEGAAFTDGKGPSIWDTFTHQHPEKIFDHSTGDVALDTYHRYKEDIVIMKNIGFEAYRFSIAWSRILPKGKLSGGINQKGIDYYNNLINEMLAKGITPYATLFHWDVPQALQDEYKGFIGYQIVNDFRDYAEVCYKAFGDRVKHWITLNEPWSFSMAGYAQGALAPGRCSEWQVEFNCLGGDSSTEPYIVAHNQILAHAEAVKVYKTKYQARQKGTIGITLVTLWYTPYSSSEADERAARRALEFSLGWFMHPLTYGDYPPVMRALVKERLPKFTREQSLLVKGSYELLGLNYYTTNYAKDNPKTTDFKPSYLNDYLAVLTTDRNGVSIGPKVNESSWQAAYPQGFRDLLIYTKEKYQNPIIYITENGHLDFDGPAKEMIEDRLRVKFHHDHLLYLNEAIKAGVRVKGYFAWSFFDNFEWASGYFIRFGLVYIDYKDNLKRIPKLSAKWFENFLKH